MSILEVNPQTRRFRSHVDKWDSIKNNEYFSFEGVADLLKQVGVRVWVWVRGRLGWWRIED